MATLKTAADPRKLLEFMFALKSAKWKDLPSLLAAPRDDPCNMAIIFAAGDGLLAAVDLLMKDPRVNPSIGLNSPIHIAARCGHFTIVERLLEDSRVATTCINVETFYKEAKETKIATAVKNTQKYKQELLAHKIDTRIIN